MDTHYKNEAFNRTKTQKYMLNNMAFRHFDDKYGKKIMNTATKTRIDAAKTASKRVDTTGDLIGNKIADKITSVGKTKYVKTRK